MTKPSAGNITDRVAKPSGMGIPRVSVGMPVFNGEMFLEKTLESLLSQTFKDFEIIISDNASTDRTEEICRAYASQDARIRYCRSSVNRGAAWNHNHVFELARGEYFKWQSHDDLCAPEFLQRCVSALDQDPGVILCYSWAQIADQKGEILRNFRSQMARMDSSYPHQRFHDAICQEHYCCEIYGLSRTSTLRKTSLIGNYTGSDRMLLAELALLARFHEIPEYLFINRDHANRSTRAVPIHLLSAWFDPNLKGKISFPRWRWLFEYGRVVARSGLGLRERMRCYAQLLPWIRQYGKRLVQDLRRAGMMLLRRLSPRAGERLSQVVHDGPRSLLGPAARQREGKS